MSKRALYAAINRGRAEALKVLRADIKKALPTGWTCALMVGWGVQFTDDKGRGRDRFSPPQLPARLQRLYDLADELHDAKFGLDNSRIR